MTLACACTRSYISSSTVRTAYRSYTQPYSHAFSSARSCRGLRKHSRAFLQRGFTLRRGALVVRFQFLRVRPRGRVSFLGGRAGEETIIFFDKTWDVAWFGSSITRGCRFRRHSVIPPGNHRKSNLGWFHEAGVLHVLHTLANYANCTKTHL